MHVTRGTKTEICGDRKAVGGGGGGVWEIKGGEEKGQQGGRQNEENEMEKTVVFEPGGQCFLFLMEPLPKGL